MSLLNPYKLLEVDRDARTEVITAAYKTLRRLRHPDGRDADRAWKAHLEWAYRTLCNPVTRHAYDRDERWMRMKPVGPANDEPIYVRDGPYAGWRLDQIAGHDPQYLETLLAHSHDPYVVNAIRAMKGRPP
jgi:hypothetical protein